jgi:seryl-tRNA synthetase
MIDIQYLRENPDKVKAAAHNKNAGISDAEIDHLIELDERRRGLITQVEGVRRERNEHAEGLKQGKPTEEQLGKGRGLKEKLVELEAEYERIDGEYLVLLKRVPNIPTADVPVGKSEDENVVAKKVGEPRKFDFEVKNHWQLGEARGWIDKERAAKVAGSRFAYLKGGLVRLQFALMQYAVTVLTDEEILGRIAEGAGLDVTNKAFIPVLPPAVARTEVYEATGRLDKEEQTYKLEDEDLWLNASAEHTLAPMYMNEILDEKDLPIRLVGYTTAFRREAGTYGKDMEGIFRLHQFDKLEMESFGTSENGLKEHLFMVAIQEYLTKSLEIPYQVLLKCTADIGKPNARGVDLEMWLPGQNRYRETHTADFISDYQSRRMRTRVRLKSGEVQLAHTNDATAFAMGRTLIAILENYQQKDGGVKVPKVLQKYFGGEEL